MDQSVVVFAEQLRLKDQLLNIVLVSYYCVILVPYLTYILSYCRP